MGTLSQIEMTSLRIAMQHINDMEELIYQYINCVEPSMSLQPNRPGLLIDRGIVRSPEVLGN